MTKTFTLILSMLIGMNFLSKAQTIYTLNTNLVSYNNSGTIKDSGGQYGNYENGENFSFLINPLSGQVILEFESFYTESSYDELSVYDGSNASADLIGVFSGSSIPETIVSSGNSLFIKWNSDYSTNKSGFVLNWTTSYEQILATNYGDKMCENTYSSDETGRIYDSGGRSGDYSNNEDCSYLINPGIGQIVLDIELFDTENNYDSLYIYDGQNDNAALIAAYSGYRTPDEIVSTSGSLFLKWTSDNSSGDNGFVINWTTTYADIRPTLMGDLMCMDTVSYEGKGYLLDQGGSFDSYENHSDCGFLIDLELGQIELTFNNFETESGYDYLYIYDGPNDSYPLLNKLSGTQSIENIVSSGSKVYFKFTSDYSGSKPGFEIKWQSVGENGIHSNTSRKYLTIFPNPATDYINISQLENSKVLFIYNQLGVLVKTHPIENGSAILDISSLTNGMYYLKNDNGASQIFIVKK